MSSRGEIWFRFLYQDSGNGDHVRSVEQTVSEMVGPEIYQTLSSAPVRIADSMSRMFVRDAKADSALDQVEIHLMAALPHRNDPLSNPLTYDTAAEKKMLFRLLSELAVRPQRQEYVVDFPPSRRLNPQIVFSEALSNLPMGLDGLEAEHCDNFLRSHTAVWMLMDEIHAAMAPIMNMPRDSYPFTPRFDSFQIKNRVLAVRFTIPKVRAIQ